MALIDVDVVKLLNTSTAKEIANAGYAMLRYYLLEGAPIGNVVMPIYEELNEQFKADQRRFSQQFVIDACAEQKKLDKEEAGKDTEEEQQDHILRTQYRDEIERIELSLRCSLEPNEAGLQSLLSRAQIDAAQLEESKQRLEQALRNLTLPVRETSVHGHGDTHEHPHPSVSPLASELNHHGHSTKTTREIHGHSERGTEHGHPSQSNSNLREIERLTSELQTIVSRLRIAQQRVFDAQRDLGRVQEEIRTAKTRSDSLRQKITTELPEKQRVRMLRATRRLDRETASLQHEDRELKQLSQENREKLTKRTHDKYDELDQLKQRLLDQTTERSYPTFLSLLENTPLPHLKTSEETVLRSTFKKMKAWQAMRTQVSQLQTGFLGMTDSLDKLRGLVAQNKAMELENIGLSQDKIAAEQRKEDWFNATLFSGGSALFLTGVGYAYELSPLFFMCPAALGVLSVVAAITTIFYYGSQYTSTGKMLDNEGAIARNNATVLVSLSADKTLAGQMTTAEQEIERLRSGIEELSSAMERLHAQAFQVEAQNGLKPEYSPYSLLLPPRTRDDAQNELQDGHAYSQ